MSDPLEYHEQAARQEERIYRTSAAAARRQRVRDLLEPTAGETVLSVGCGPGFEPVELAPSVGDDGCVLGVDRSEAMLALAADRCDGHERVSLAAADAAALPVADGAVDAATAVQVYEYVPDVAAALSELHRALAPAGRAVICDADWDATVWRSPDTERTARVLDAFDDHCPHPRLGSRLAPELRAAGFRIESVVPHTIVEMSLDEDAFVTHLLPAVREFAAAHAAVGPDEAEAWADDLREQDRRGETFFSYTQYCYLVRPAQ
ncbi:methyltransferase domain-containing protein [Haloarcula litorea]|uniref:methyltransferase domain-containing protein n=1 Tax=Haloarcula litorea TaxID=3032579 RepID=UPI0023E8AAC8|nr:methyltransferase domain-containing protein [Halomicroarcula sp. GDY20]